MSFQPYECLHVPVQAAKVRVFGLPVWVVVAVAAAIVGKLYGPWVFLAPALFLAAAVLLVVVLRSRRRARAATTAHAASSAGDGAPVEVLTGAPVVVLSGLGALPCMGCGASPATVVLELPGYRIPVCGPCEVTATIRLAGMAAAGTLPVELRGMLRGPR